jgi:GDP-D-mannose dehydratase
VTQPAHQGARFLLHHGDLTDSTNLIRVPQDTQPDEVYNLGAQSQVAVSFETPEYRKRRRHRRAQPARSHPHPEAGKQDAVLPSVH